MWPFSSTSEPSSATTASMSGARATETPSRAEERAVVRKIDWILMPLLTISFGLQYYDKAVLNSASIFGIIKDLGLSTTTIDESGRKVVSTLRYSTANSAFYWGYIVAVLPFALLLQRAPLARTLSACILFWGITVILTVVVKSYEGLVVQRVFLGVLESAVSPGFVMITTQWYRKSEQASRLGIWYSATGIFSAFSGVVNYGLGKAGGSLAPWKYMYLFAGSWTILWALVVLVVVPDSPRTSQRWFSDREREILIRRQRENLSGRVELATFQWAQAREAVSDVKVWIFMVMGGAIYISNGGVTAFGARIVSSFGYDSLTTIAILIPGGAFTCAAIYLSTYLASKFPNSLTLLLPLSCVPAIVGAIVIWTAPWHHRGVPLFGYYLLPTFGAPYVLLLALAAANVAGSTKKAISTGAIFVGYNAGNIAAPYTVITAERDVKYRSTWISVIVSMGVTMLLSLVLRWMLARENRRRDDKYGKADLVVGSGGSDRTLDDDERPEDVEKDGDADVASTSRRGDDAAPLETTTKERTEPPEDEDEDAAERVERQDLTDWQNERFRYTL